MRIFHIITYSLVIVGALNWGLVGFFNFDLVATLLGQASLASNIVYALVGISALFNVISEIQLHEECGQECVNC